MSAFARSACCRSRIGVRPRNGVGGGIGSLRRDFRSGINIGQGPVAAGFRSRFTRRDFRIRSVVRRQSGFAAPASPRHSQPQSSSEPPPPRPKRPLYIRIPILLSLTLLTFTLGFTMAAAPALSTAQTLIQPPSDEETLSLYSPSTSELADIESQIFSHPLTRSLLQDENYIASRPHLKIPEQMRAHNLTGGTLLGPDKIAVPPLQFTTADGSTFVSLQYVGTALCGHPGIVHGGLLATLLDEGLARCCFPALPNKVAVTASLKIDYRAPAMAGQILVLKAETTKVEGRKAWVKGRLETLVDEGKGEKAVVLTEGEALFIEPRQAASMKRVVS